MGEDLCFMCGQGLDQTNRSDEHVFPKWLQRRHDLWDQTLSLLNGSLIRYKHLRVPCCQTCNRVHLGGLERQVSSAFVAGYEAVTKLDDRILFLWLAKISYGLIYREVFLRLDRADPSSPGIVPEDLVREFRVHHLLLQGARSRITWSQLPASVRLFRTKCGGEPRAEFDYADDVRGPFLAIRSGEVGVVATLQDWGASFTLRWRKYDEAAMLSALAPLQFRELCAHGIYQSTLFNRRPKLLITQASAGIQVTVLPLAGLAGGPLYDTWDTTAYGAILARALEVPFASVTRGDRLITFLTEPQGGPMEVDFRAWTQ